MFLPTLRQRLPIALCLSLSLCLIPIDSMDACEGTPRRLCSRSVWFTMLAQQNIVLPPDGQVNLPLVLMPFVFWDTLAPCAQPALWNGDEDSPSRAPVQGEVSVNLSFTSYNSGSMMDLGMQQFPISLNGPGLQTMEVTVDVSELPRGETWVGNLAGTFTVNFENGFGAGSLCASGNATVCLIPPCNAEGDMPMVGLEYLSPSAAAYQACRRGDQTYFHFGLTNYCLDKSAVVDLSTNIKQLAGLPDGFDPAMIVENYQDYVHAISDPTADYFNHVLYTGGSTCTQLEEGDPHTNPPSQTGQVTLNAGESKTVTVIMNSFGMCGNASCNKLDLGGEVTMSDGTESYVCSSTALYIDDVLPKSRRCEYEDHIKTDAFAGTCYTPATYFDMAGDPIPHATTHTYGSELDGGQCLFGENVSSGQLSEKTDVIRLDQDVLAYSAGYSLTYTGQTGFTENDVIAMGLPDMVDQSVVIPVITYAPDFHISIGIQFNEDLVTIQSADQTTTYFEGSWAGFMDEPPPDFSYDMNSCRTFTKTYDPSGIDICPEVYSYCYLNRPPETTSHVIGVVDQNGSPVTGTASLIGLNSGIVELPSPTFSGEIELNVTKAALPASPEYARGWLAIDVAEAVSPYLMPLCFSRLDNMDVEVFNEQDLCKAYDIATARWSNTNINVRSDFSVTKTCPGWANADFTNIIGDQQQPAGLGEAVPVVIDGSNCAAPCNVMRVEGNNNVVRDIVFVGFPEVALTVEGNQNAVENCTFTDNQGIGLMVSGNDNAIGNDAGGGSAFANNAGGGIVVMSGTGNAILSNTFDRNAGMAIDLGGDGMTPNDPGDNDEGPNNLQNFPVLMTAEVIQGTTTVSGSLNSTPNTTFSIQFYSTDTCAADGSSEGMVLLESMDVTTDANGDVDFDIDIESAATTGHFITALATDPDGNTSEFSRCSDPVSSDVRDIENSAFVLMPPQPNPFATETVIPFRLKTAGPVRLEVIDGLGRMIQLLENDDFPPGEYQTSFSGDDLQAGIYFCRIETGGFVGVQKMMLIR